MKQLRAGSRDSGTTPKQGGTGGLTSASISLSPGRGGAREGAGRPALHELVDDLVSFDIRDWWWSLELAALRRGNALDGAAVRLRLGPRPEDAVEVTTSSGGACPRHARFLCPGCGGRAAKLYLRSGAYRCRRCHGLVYRSQRSSIRARGWALEAKVVAQLAKGNQRPPRMHRTTYDRLLTTLVLAQAMRTMELAQRLGDLSETERLKEGARTVRGAIEAMRHKASRPPPRSEESVEKLLASLAL